MGFRRIGSYRILWLFVVVRNVYGNLSDLFVSILSFKAECPKIIMFKVSRSYVGSFKFERRKSNVTSWTSYKIIFERVRWKRGMKLYVFPRLANFGAHFAFVRVDFYAPIMNIERFVSPRQHV